MNPVFDNYAEPPGVFIREELEARGWTQRDLAFILDCSEQTVTKLVSGKSGISAEMAKALAEAFGTSASLWAGLQKEWELREARDPDPAIRARAAMQTAYPIREMISRGWLEEGEQSVLEMQFDRFFEGREQIAFAAAARKSSKEHSPEELAWLFRVRQLARGMDVPAYSADALQEAIRQLRTLVIDPDDVRQVPAILHSAGVRFVVVEKLANCKIDGVCTWLDDVNPVVGLTLRHNRLDNFWFVLRHELEHVLKGHGKSSGWILDDLDGEGSSDAEGVEKEEREANSAALNFAFPRERLLSFYARKSPYISERDVIGFAGLTEVHPAIVVGQLQYIKKDYAWLRKWLVSIRSPLIENCLFDGFGFVAKAAL
jgi:HTH-type transcriptional regulator/antitoxin HigA